MAVSLFASCAPKLLQKSHALTSLANRFTWPNPSNKAVCPLQLPSERGGGAVRGHLLQHGASDVPEMKGTMLLQKPILSQAAAAASTGEMHSLHIYSFPCYWDPSPFLGGS